jgi:hypothetical protein
MEKKSQMNYCCIAIIQQQQKNQNEKLINKNLIILFWFWIKRIYKEHRTSSIKLRRKKNILIN